MLHLWNLYIKMLHLRFFLLLLSTVGAHPRTQLSAHLVVDEARRLAGIDRDGLTSECRKTRLEIKLVSISRAIEQQASTYAL